MWDKDRDDGVPYTSFGTGTGMMAFHACPMGKDKGQELGQVLRLQELIEEDLQLIIYCLKFLDYLNSCNTFKY